MSRSLWKPIFVDPRIASQLQVDENLLELKEAAFANNEQKQIIIFSRNTVLTEEFLNHSLYIYNGIRYFTIKVDETMIGHRTGEFSPTKKKPIPKKKKK